MALGKQSEEARGLQVPNQSELHSPADKIEKTVKEGKGSRAGEEMQAKEF